MSHVGAIRCWIGVFLKCSILKRDAVGIKSAFSCFAGFFFLDTLYLQQVRGFSALYTGLITLPLAAMMSVTASWSGRLVGQFATHAIWWLMTARGAAVLALGFVSNAVWARASTERVAQLVEGDIRMFS